MSVTPIISTRNIKKSFGQTHALRGVSLDVTPGEVANEFSDLVDLIK
jgi:ABC-type sugar transport system ATPase subunit